MTIADTKVPQVLDLGKILHHKEVVLICLGLTISGFAWTSQVSELMDIVFYFTDGLRVGWFL